MNKESHIAHFDSVDSLIEYIKTTPCDSSWDGKRDSHNINTKGFNGTNTLQEAYDLAQCGWPEGLERIAKNIGLVNAGGKSKVQIFDVAGDYPVIGRAIAGCPDSMTRRISGHAKRRPVIELLINMGCNGNISRQAIENRGVAIGSVIDELESLGYSVGINVVSHVDIRTIGTRTMYLTVKRPGEIIDLEKLIYFMAHISFLRRLCFAQRETTCTVALAEQCYGSTSDVIKWEEDVYFNKNDSLNEDCATLILAIKHVKEMINKSFPDLFDKAA